MKNSESQHYHVYESVIPDSSAIRVAFPNTKVVVKLLDPKQSDTLSVKFWKGDLDKIASCWSMEKVDRPLTDQEIAAVNKSLAYAKDCSVLIQPLPLKNDEDHLESDSSIDDQSDEGDSSSFDVSDF